MANLQIILLLATKIVKWTQGKSAMCAGACVFSWKYLLPLTWVLTGFTERTFQFKGFLRRALLTCYDISGINIYRQRRSPPVKWSSLQKWTHRLTRRTSISKPVLSIYITRVILTKLTFTQRFWNVLSFFPCQMTTFLNRKQAINGDPDLECFKFGNVRNVCSFHCKVL